jgi:hypothetical protein
MFQEPVAAEVEASTFLLLISCATTKSETLLDRLSLLLLK